VRGLQNGNIWAHCADRALNRQTGSLAGDMGKLGGRRRYVQSVAYIPASGLVASRHFFDLAVLTPSLLGDDMPLDRALPMNVPFSPAFTATDTSRYCGVA
jgi:hypothetical protein